MLFYYTLYLRVFSLFRKQDYNTLNPSFFVGTRMVIAGLLMLLYQYLRHPDQFGFKKEHFWRVFRLAAFNIYLTNMFEFWGLQYLTSFKTCFIYSLSPFMAALLSYVMFSEKMTLKKWQGLAIGFIGFIPILLHETAAEERLGHLFFVSWAELSVMGAAICSVYGWILLKQLVQQNGYSPLMANGLSMLLGGFMALAHSYITEDWHPVPVTNTVPFLECAVLLIVISNLTCYNLYGYLLRKFTATFMSFAGFTTPLFTALFGWLYLGEVITAPFYISAIIVFAGLLLFYQEELKLGYYAKPETA